MVIAGCTTSVCVRATAIDSMQHGYHTLVAAEAVGDFDPALHAVHLRDMDARYADVMPVSELLAYFELVATIDAGLGRAGRMDLNLHGRTALITGASKGIGFATASTLADEGCNLILVSRTAADLDTARLNLTARSSVRVVTHALDVSKSASIDKLAAEHGESTSWSTTRGHSGRTPQRDR